ncbi:MAG TPA: hypothetical protein VD866_25535 [Urbifossiella sp.]|nr:hypothetical protein [Urbifossiella sp.]
MADNSHHIPTGAPAPDVRPRFTLRHLPFPAKLVLSTFLLAVGVGYTSAMVQLHMQHGDRDGKPLPTMDNVVAVFAGKVWKKGPEDAEERAPSKLELLVRGDKDGDIGGVNMAPAFFKHDGADYRKQAADPVRKPKLDAEREGERRALVAWAGAAPNVRKKAYEENSFTLPKLLAKMAVTAAYSDKNNPGTVQIKSLIANRCARCHRADGDMREIPLTTYEAIVPFLPVTMDIPEGGGYVDSGRLMSLEKLTQSTHAHLLSFAVLFTCTGLIFAFTGLPGWFRGFVGPIVLLAQVADIACWWLARLPEPFGPGFARAIMFTGAVVGGGLMVQIVFGLFGMYGPKGRTVLVLLFAVATGGFGAVWTTTIDPYLKDEKQKAVQRAADEKKRIEDEKAKLDKKAEPKQGPDKVAPATGPSEFERLFTGPWKGAPWGKDGKKGDRIADGAMVRAFFDKETDFEGLLKEDPPEAEKLVPQREGERNAFLAWAKAAPDVRKKAYEDNKFALPEALVGKATPEFTEADGKFLKVATLIETRCLRCHNDGNKNGSLDTYERLSRYFVPRAKE